MVRYTTVLAAATLVLLLGILAAGCTGTPPASTGEMKKFGSSEEIRQFLKDTTEKAGQYGSGITDGSMRNAEEAVSASVPAAQGASKSSPGTAGITGTSDHSTTTVQVAGVDEPDFVKNDGRFIYLISGNRLVIVDAYPAADARIVSETELEDTVQEIFVTGDRLVLFSTGTPADTGAVSGSTGSMERVAYMPSYYRMDTVTTATIYDISDRNKPSVLADFAVDGSYADARMIKGIVYLLTRENVYSYDDIVVPVVRKSGTVIAEPDVYYFDNPESNYVFSTVTAFDAGSGAEKDAKTFLIGSGNVLYVSADAMYIGYQRWNAVYRTYADSPVIGVSAVKAGGASSGATAAGITYEEFNKLSEPEKQAVIADLKDESEESILKQEVDQTTTIIHKIAIDNGKINYVARGEVPGYVKNQFSMDEYDTNLRVATTSTAWTRSGQYEYNNVFVLDGGMKTIGSLTHIAGQEQIYATRFIKDRLYMVTFKRIDPFFVIDLSDPADPAILGRLKIPGYSDYLYPYDKNTIIGVGKETAANDWGGVSTRGVKLALFDVSDVENPEQIDKVEIGYSGTDSAALYDHKAFLFDKGKNLLVLPIRQVTANETGNGIGSGQRIWYGAYVFGVTPETGFSLRGTVKHGTAPDGYYWYGSSADEVKRSLYIGNNLFTISSAQVIASDLADINTTISTITLSGVPDYPDVPYKNL